MHFPFRVAPAPTTDHLILSVRYVELAQKDASVQKVLRLLSYGPLDWVSMYCILEVIGKDVGGLNKIERRGWAEASEIRRFKHTANDPNVIGDTARHGTPPGESPRKPMSFDEAKTLIARNIQAWLEAK
jgi:hypothetical protein